MVEKEIRSIQQQGVISNPQAGITAAMTKNTRAINSSAPTYLNTYT